MKIETETQNNIKPNNNIQALSLNNSNSACPDFQSYIDNNFQLNLDSADLETAQQAEQAAAANAGQAQQQPSTPETGTQTVNNKNKNSKKSLENNNIPVQTDKITNMQHFVHINHNNLKSENKIKINPDDFKKQDLDFIKTCLINPSINLNNLNMQNSQINFSVSNNNHAGQVSSYKSLNISKELANLIEYSFKTQKPVRIEFGKDSSVILKSDRDGKLTAEFISSNEAMAYVLKSSIPNLKTKLDSENISYNEIFYNDSSQQNNQNKKNNKGDD